LFVGSAGSEGEDVSGVTKDADYTLLHNLQSTTAGNADANVQNLTQYRILTGTGDTADFSGMTFTNGTQTLVGFYEIVQPASFTQTAYRFRYDDGSETTASWYDNENTAITNISTSTTYRLRIEAHETASVTGTLNAKLEFSSDASSCTTGSWTALDTSTTAWRVTASSNITNDDPTTNQLTTSSKTFTAGNIFDTQNEDVTGVSLNNTQSEWEWAIQGVTASANTTYRFRITDSGSALSSYTNCARLTTANSGSGVYHQPHFRIRAGDAAGLNADSDWAAALDTNVTMDAGKVFRIRFEVENTAGGVSKTWRLEHRYRTSTGNWGAWAFAPDLSINPEDGPITMSGDPHELQFADAAAASTNLLAGSSQTFDTGGTGETNRTTGALTISAEHAEYEFSVVIRGTWGDPSRMKDNDQLEFRIAESSGTILTGVYNIPRITVNMPDYYIGAATIETPGRIGPFKDTNGNLYTMVEPSFASGSSDPEIMKSTDGGKNWDFVNVAGHPSTVSDLESADIFQSGDTLHICIQRGSGDDKVFYSTFRMSDHASPDTWGVAGETVTTPATLPSQQACGIVKRSDGTVVLAYNQGGTNQRAVYKIRSSGGVWGSEQIIDNTASVNIIFSGIVLGASDKTHFFYKDDTNDDLYYKNLSSADVLTTDGNRVLIDNDVTSTANYWSTDPPIYWDDAGTERIMTIFRDQSDSLLYSVVVTADVAAARKQISDSAILESPGGTTSNQPVADVVVDSATDKQYSLLVPTSDKDVYLDTASNDGGWGTDTKILDKSAENGVQWVRGNIFTHSAGNGGGKVYGFWYDDGGDGDDGFSWYGEYSIVSDPTFTQNDFRWYENADSVTLSNLWGSIITGDNEDVPVIPAGYNPPGVGEQMRLQINMTVGTANLSATTQAFKVQFKAGTDQDCSTGSWTDVGAKGSTTTAWRFFDNASLSDNASEVNQISTSDVVGGYSETNPTGTNPNAVNTGQDMEWDFPIESVDGQVVSATTYAFRIIKSDNSTISYTAGDCPTVETEPGTANMMRHGNVFVDGVEKGFFWAD
jgi:hypothetical protein